MRDTIDYSRKQKRNRKGNNTDTESVVLSHRLNTNPIFYLLYIRSQAFFFEAFDWLVDESDTSSSSFNVFFTTLNHLFIFEMKFSDDTKGRCVT